MFRTSSYLPILLCLAACGGEANPPSTETPASFGKKAPRVAASDAGAPWLRSGGKKACAAPSR